MTQSVELQTKKCASGRSYPMVFVLEIMIERNGHKFTDQMMFTDIEDAKRQLKHNTLDKLTEELLNPKKLSENHYYASGFNQVDQWCNVSITTKLIF